MVQTIVEHAEAPEKVTQAWQPIETVPRDGVEVLIWGEWVAGGRSIWRILHVIWCPEGYRLIGGQYVQNATHWMPLPTAPRSDDRSESSTSE